MLKVAIVGATGLVGQVMLQVLEEMNLPITTLIPVASAKSVGKVVHFKNEPYTICSMAEALEKRPDIAIFSAGGETSLSYAPQFAAIGTFVIDNSSAWRMDPAIKLIVPEINGASLSKTDLIIANPNCSTIQMVMALKPLHDVLGLKRVIVSTYQSVTGTGVKAVSQMMKERNNEVSEHMAYKYPIDLNCIPHCDVFLDNGYTKEEMKLVNETRKILNLPNLAVTATAVRVPVLGGHSESINVSFEKSFDLASVKKLLQNAPGIVLQDEPSNNLYPMPITAKGKNEVFVGRIRIDESEPNTINMWVVADNLRKGAATNAVQIAQLLIDRKLI